MFILLLVSPIYSEWWWWCDESSSVSMNSSFFCKAVLGTLFLSVTQSVPRRLSFESLKRTPMINGQRSWTLSMFKSCFCCLFYFVCDGMKGENWIGRSVSQQTRNLGNIPDKGNGGTWSTNMTKIVRRRGKSLENESDIQKLFVCWLFACCWLVLLIVSFVGCGWPWLQAGRSLLEKIVTCCSPLFERTWIPKTSKIKYLPFSNSILQHNCP